MLQLIQIFLKREVLRLNWNKESTNLHILVTWMWIFFDKENMDVDDSFADSLRRRKILTNR